MRCIIQERQDCQPLVIEDVQGIYTVEKIVDTSYMWEANPIKDWDFFVNSYMMINYLQIYFKGPCTLGQSVCVTLLLPSYCDFDHFALIFNEFWTDCGTSHFWCVSLFFFSFPVLCPICSLLPAFLLQRTFDASLKLLCAFMQHNWLFLFMPTFLLNTIFKHLYYLKCILQDVFENIWNIYYLE